MLTDLFKRSFRREINRSVERIINESRRKKNRYIHESLEDALDDVGGAGGDLGSALDSQISPAEDNKIEELKIQKQINKRNAQLNDVILGWVEKLDEFVIFINDPMNTESIKYITDSAATGSILEKIKNSEARRLTRVATECSALAQSLRSYIIGGIEDEDIDTKRLDLEDDDELIEPEDEPGDLNDEPQEMEYELDDIE